MIQQSNPTWFIEVLRRTIPYGQNMVRLMIERGFGDDANHNANEVDGDDHVDDSDDVYHNANEVDGDNHVDDSDDAFGYDDLLGHIESQVLGSVGSQKGIDNMDIVRVLYPRYRGPPVMAQTNLNMAMFPPAANGWGTKYPVPDMIPPLLAEGGGPPT
jgi:hypothetical protein